MRIKILYAHFKTDLFILGTNLGSKLGNQKEKPVEMVYDFNLQMLMVKTMFNDKKFGLVPVTDIASLVPAEFESIWNGSIFLIDRDRSKDSLPVPSEDFGSAKSTIGGGVGALVGDAQS